MKAIGDKSSLAVNPTLACGNLLNFKEDLDILEEVENRIVHIDIMDGHYVPNLCFNLDTVRRIRENYDFLIDVHLMVSHPGEYLEELSRAGADYVSFHLDAAPFAIRLLRQIREFNMGAGIVLNPSQPASALSEVLPYVDLVLVMGVEPGFSGQKFIPGTFEKIQKLAQIRDEKGLSCLIEVDGGIDDVNGAECLRKGADILVSGAFGVFRKMDGLKKDYLDFKQKVIG